MDFDPSSLSLADRYKLLIGGVVPRPIAVVSTLSPAGRPNVAPFSFFAGVGSNPMSLLFCPANRPDGGDKDTMRNLLSGSGDGSGACAEFVVSVASSDSIRRIVACAEELPYGASEFDLAGLTATPSAVVRPPRVGESPMAFECRVRQIFRLNPGAPSGGNIVIGEVVHVFTRPGVADEACRVDPAALDAIGRMAGLTYCTTRERFEVPWGAAALGP